MDGDPIRENHNPTNQKHTGKDDRPPGRVGSAEISLREKSFRAGGSTLRDDAILLAGGFKEVF